MIIQKTPKYVIRTDYTLTAAQLAMWFYAWDFLKYWDKSGTRYPRLRALDGLSRW
jgi:hypothetical protein